MTPAQTADMDVARRLTEAQAWCLYDLCLGRERLGKPDPYPGAMHGAGWPGLSTIRFLVEHRLIARTYLLADPQRMAEHERVDHLVRDAREELAQGRWEVSHQMLQRAMTISTEAARCVDRITRRGQAVFAILVATEREKIAARRKAFLRYGKDLTTNVPGMLTGPVAEDYEARAAGTECQDPGTCGVCHECQRVQPCHVHPPAARQGA